MASYLHARGQMPGVNPGVPRNERVARSPGAPDVAGAVQNPGKDNWMVAAAQRDPMWRGGASGWSGGSGSSGYTGNYSSAGGVPRMRAYRNGGVVKGEKDAVGDYRKALSKMKDYRNK